MKVSLNWVRQFTDITTSDADIIRKIGEQLGAVEEVVDLSARYRGIVVVRVVSAESHPNADKLKVCLIDDGGKINGVERNDSGHVQVVCGAPNVTEGMLAAWLPPGSTVPKSFDSEPFVLEAREIRGEVSNGMLASAQELAIGDDHGGIVTVDIEAQPGADFAEVYDLNDTVIDIENKMFTHRPDCFGILGVAREIAGIQGLQFASPEWYRQRLAIASLEKTKTKLTVRNEIQGVVPRFMAVLLDSITVKQSPLMVQAYLARVGIRPINNVVDATNYLMALTGQPLHAYDADKLQKVTNKKDLQLETRYSKKGDRLTLLDGKELAFEDDSTILITSHDTPVGIGGVMGGIDTEVDENTKRIVLECANFDMYAIRRTSMGLGLFTDAVTRFNKGQSPHQNDRVIGEAIAMLEYVSGATVASNIVDEVDELQPQPSITVAPQFVSDRLGIHTSANDIQNHLEAVEFIVRPEADALVVQPPFWRTDIAIPEDIVEEVGRLMGFDTLPKELPTRSLAPVERNAQLDFCDSIRNILAAAGSNEALTYSFVHGGLLEKATQDTSKAFCLSNALSPDLQYYRLSLSPSLLEKVHANIKAGYGELALFEIGKSHVSSVMSDDEPAVPAEHNRLAFVYSADEKTWQQIGTGSAFYQARAYADYLFSRLGITYDIVPLTDDLTGDSLAEKQMIAPFATNRSGAIMIGDKLVGVVGEAKRAVSKALKLPASTAVFEVDIDALRLAPRINRYKPLSKYPKIQQDISLKVSGGITYQDVYSVADNVLAKVDHLRYTISPLDIYQSERDASSKHIALRITAWSDRKTMASPELGQILDTIADAAAAELDAVRL